MPTVTESAEPTPATRMRLDTFDATKGLDRGRPRWFELLWYLTKCCFFLSALPWPGALKRGLLKAFGAKVGQGVVIKPRVNIHLPWRLELGEHVWIGEEAFILNFEPVTVGSHACISQRAFLCTGNHDYRKPDFPYRNRPIDIGAGAWVGAMVFVGPGAGLGAETVATAGSVVVDFLPSGMVCAGNPCKPVRPRWPQSQSSS
ncbi:MAG: WcaF family extracellular polysaccharide biosynthesis acetyltransferase [Opitutales bacterium]